jgi:hypothetical protein
VRPLLLAPVLLVVGLAIGGALSGAGVPDALALLPSYLGITGAIIAMIFFFVGLVNALSPGAGQLSPEEAAAWAEYVRQNGGEVEPRRTSGVLLAMAIGVFAVGCTSTDPRLDDGSRAVPGTTAASAQLRTASS